MNVPPLGPAVPRRGNALTRVLGRAALRVTGWRIEGDFPNEPKLVIIVAPHTSNWDFFVGLMAYFALGFRASFLAKHTIFVWPAGPFLRWLGGVPVERSVSRDRVAESIAAFEAAEKLILVIAPEGTRRRAPKWKTGFYHVAQGANVPILPVAFDFARKLVALGEPYRVTGDADREIPEIRQLFAGFAARHPENFVLS